MKEPTKDALTKAGFDYSDKNGRYMHIWIGNDNGRAGLNVTEEQIPLVLAALATPSPFTLTDEERAAIYGSITDADEYAKACPSEDTQEYLTKRITALRNLLTRSESASPAQMRDFTDEELARHEAFVRSKGRVVRRDVFGVGTPPEPSLTDEVERPTLVRLDDALTVLDAILTEGVTDKRAIIQQMARRVPTLPDAPPDPPNLDIRAHTPEADEIWATVAKAAERCPAWIRPHVEQISRQIGAEIRERLLQKYASPEPTFTEAQLARVRTALAEVVGLYEYAYGATPASEFTEAVIDRLRGG